MVIALRLVLLLGEKWITTVWMREGVDDEHPWSEYDPNGVKMIDMESDIADAAEEGGEEYENGNDEL